MLSNTKASKFKLNLIYHVSFIYRSLHGLYINRLLVRYLYDCNKYKFLDGTLNAHKSIILSVDIAANIFSILQPTQNLRRQNTELHYINTALMVFNSKDRSFPSSLLGGFSGMKQSLFQRTTFILRMYACCGIMIFNVLCALFFSYLRGFPALGMR